MMLDDAGVSKHKRPQVSRPVDWLGTAQVAEILGYTRQHTTYLARQGEGQTDPKLYLLSTQIVRGKKRFRRFDAADVWAFRNGPHWRLCAPRRSRDTDAQPEAA